MGKIQEIRDLLEESKTNDFAYDLIMERSADYLSYLLSELDDRDSMIEALKMDFEGAQQQACTLLQDETGKDGTEQN